MARPEGHLSAPARLLAQPAVGLRHQGGGLLVPHVDRTQTLLHAGLLGVLHRVESACGRGRTAPIHDHMKGRISEMAFISGLVARKGKELGIDTTCNAAVAEIDRRINSGELAMDRSNFELLKQMTSK